MLVSVRIIAGSLRSRRLEAPAGLATRPTSDRLRETLFNVLAARTAGAAFLDLYAGSGAVGIEALSRGAARVEFVERDPAVLKILSGNLEKLGLRAGFRIHSSAVGAFLRRAAKALPQPEPHDPVCLSTSAACQATSVVCKGTTSVVPKRPERHGALAPGKFLKYEVVFLDPPYDAAEEYAATLGLLGGSALGLLTAEAVVIAEHRRKAEPRQRLEDRYGSLERTRLLEQGDAALSFYAVSRFSAQQ
jgi:16S rRNA G966 N2-methylase RsmD